MFEQYAHALKDRFPELMIEGDNYPPPPVKAMVAQFLSVAKLVLIGLIVSGINPFPHLNMPTPNVYTWATENKVSIINICTVFIFEDIVNLYSLIKNWKMK